MNLHPGVPISISFESQMIFSALDGMKQTLTTFDSKYTNLVQKVDT